VAPPRDVPGLRHFALLPERPSDYSTAPHPYGCPGVDLHGLGGPSRRVNAFRPGGTLRGLSAEGALEGVDPTLGATRRTRLEDHRWSFPSDQDDPAPLHIGTSKFPTQRLGNHGSRKKRRMDSRLSALNPRPNRTVPDWSPGVSGAPYSPCRPGRAAWRSGRRTAEPLVIGIPR
jgi:hypothetical protein